MPVIEHWLRSWKMNSAKSILVHCSLPPTSNNGGREQTSLLPIPQCHLIIRCVSSKDFTGGKNGIALEEYC